jgi:hypothetical protein
MLVAVTLGSLLLGISTGTVALLLRVERTGREHTRWALAVHRLAAQFRDDVHATRELLPAGTGRDGPWRLTLDAQRTVTYRLAEESLQREEAVTGRPVRRASYLLPEGCTARIGLESARSPAVATLIVAPRQSPAPLYRENRMDAVLGRDVRFTRGAAGSR